MVKFHKQQAITPEIMVRYGPLSNLKKTNVTEFHKIVIQSIQLRERTWFHMMNFHKQRATIPEGLV